MGIAEFRFRKTLNSATKYVIREEESGKKIIEINAARDFDPAKLSDRSSTERKELKRELDKNKDKFDPRDFDEGKLRKMSDFISKNRHNFTINLRH